MLQWFFFSSRRRHTRCLSDWSSDVCSSDLEAGVADAGLAEALEDVGEEIGGDPFAGVADRSEERRVGKECRSRWSADHLKKKKYTVVESSTDRADTN